MVNVLITGNKGFIGSHLESYLKTVTKYNIFGYDIYDTMPQEKMDYIIHLASTTTIRNSYSQPQRYFMNNLYLTDELLERAKNDKAKFIFSSSGSIQKPSNPYSLAKKHSEEWINLYAKLYDMQTSILRFFNVYGDGQRKGVIYEFMKNVKYYSPCIIYGEGNHIRDFISVKDVCNIIYRMITDEIEFTDYDVGTGVGTSINKLYGILERNLRNNYNIEIDKKYIPMSFSEADKLIANKIVNKQYIKLEKGINSVIDYVFGSDLK